LPEGFAILRIVGTDVGVGHCKMSIEADGWHWISRTRSQRWSGLA
jgi:hypothetical protein